MSDTAITTASGSAYEVLKPVLRKFVDGYLAGEKASHVVRTLRPKLKRPQELASRWLNRPDVKAAIAERRVNLLEAAGIHQEMIVRELARIGFGKPKQLYDEHGSLLPPDKLDDDAAAMVAGFEVEEIVTGKGASRVVKRVTKIKRWDKRQALRDLAAIGGLERDSEKGRSTIFNIQINL